MSYTNVFVVACHAVASKNTETTSSTVRYSHLNKTHSKNDRPAMEECDSNSKTSRLSITLGNSKRNAPTHRSIQSNLVDCGEGVAITSACGSPPTTNTAASAISFEVTNVSRNPRPSTSRCPDNSNPSLAEIEKYMQMKRNRSLRKQVQIALTLFFVTFTFMVCYIPSALLDLNAWGIDLGLEDIGEHNVEVLLGLFWFSVPANPVIYAFTSPRFRNETKILINRLGSCQVSLNDSM